MSKHNKELVDKIEDRSIKKQRCRAGGSQRTVSCFYNSLNYQSSCDKSTRSIVFVQQKVINNLVPLETEEKLLKKSFIDIAVNTEITGTLQNENDSVTMVRKLKNYYNYTTYKVKTKSVQTINYKLYSFSDKACWQRVPTGDYGTQVIETKGSNKKSQKQYSDESLEIQHSDILQTDIGPKDLRRADSTQKEMTQIAIIQSDTSETDLRQIDMVLRDYLSQTDIRQAELEDTENRYELKRSFSRNSNLSNIRRWALSNNLTRGPDF